MYFDLHVHTNYSDGLLKPRQVVDLAVEKNLDGIAITDHDTVAGIEEAIEYNKQINNPISIIPGIEFGSIHQNEEVHILGYFIDYKSEKLRDISGKLKENRYNRSLKMVSKLNKVGLEISMEELEELAHSGLISRSHMASVLVAKGYAANSNEAFNKYLNRGQVGYVEKLAPSVKDTIDLIHSLGGLAILAHPGLLRDKSIIKYCIANDIDGLEIIHSKHSSADFKYLLELATKNNLIRTGGSDCHGKLKNGDYLLGKYYINIRNIAEMKGRI